MPAVQHRRCDFRSRHNSAQAPNLVQSERTELSYILALSIPLIVSMTSFFAEYWSEVKTEPEAIKLAGLKAKLNSQKC